MFLTFDHKLWQIEANFSFMTPKFSYFRCNHFKLHLVTNCTQKDIKAIVGKNRGYKANHARNVPDVVYANLIGSYAACLATYHRSF